MRVTDERGQGGLEVLPFGFLVLVVGTLLVVNVWAVIDAKLAAESAAREAARAYVEAADEADALARGEAAAHEALAGHHRDHAERVRVVAPAAGSFQRCARIAWEVAYDVPTLTLPWIGGLGGGVITARATHAEVIDAHRSGLPVDPTTGARCG